MGTTFITGATKQDIVNQLLDERRRDGSLVESHQAVEDGEPVLWTVEKANGYQFIHCHVLRQENIGWGYKSMDESVSPNFSSVPLEWLDKYPCKTPDGRKGYSDEWRADVRAAKAA